MIRRIAAPLLASALLAVALSAGPLLAEPTPSRDADTRRATLLVTAGLSGKLVDDERTLADLVATIRALVDERRAEGRAVLVLDAGVTFVPYAESRYDAGDTMARALGAAGCEVIAPHPVDLSVGAERVAEMAAELPFSVLRAFDTDDPALAGFDPVARLRLGDVPVEVRAFDHPDYVGDLAASGVDAAPRDPTTALARVDRSGSEPTALQIAILHSRGDGTGIASRRMTWSLVERPSGFDLLLDPDLEADLVLRRDGVDGRSHPVFLVGRELSTAHPWDVAAIDLELSRDADGAWRIDDVEQSVHRADPEIATDPALVATIRESFAAFRAAYGERLPEEAPADRESLERFVLGAVRETAAAEVAILNQGSLRPVDPRYFAVSPITRETVMRLLSYDQGLVVGELTGEELRQLAAESVTRVDGEGSPRQSRLRFLGLDFEVENRGTPGATVTGFRINGRKLYPNDRYRVVTNSYLADGGDGYPVLADMAGERLARDGEPLEAREDVVLPRLDRAAEPLDDPSTRGLWRFGLENLTLAFDGVEVDADPAYGDVSDSRASAEGSQSVRADLRLFADQEWSKLRWENRLRARFGLLDTQSDDEEELVDDLRFETSAVFLGSRLVGGNPYLGYIFDSELRPDEEDGETLPRQIEHSLAAGVEWRARLWPRIRLGLLARAQDDTERAERLGLIVETDFLWEPPAPWPPVRAHFLAERVEDGDASIERFDLELRVPFEIRERLSVAPGIDLYRYEDSRLPGAAEYRRFSLALIWAWTEKWQR